jgi:uncharacterized protein (DUF58 family)
MLSNEILNKIKHIEIYTKRMLSGSMVGDSRSAVKGSGLEFDQIREYQVGDDVRFIDWNSSARMNKLLVKQYIEERNRTVLLAVDVSKSNMFSSSNELRQDLIAHVASVLALVADYGKDHVGLLLFSNVQELVMPVKRGRHHTRALMEKLFTYQARNAKTDINVALSWASQHKRKDAMLFIISDFIADSFEKKLGIVASMHDVVNIRISDKNEIEFPKVGFLEIQDPETGVVQMIDARKKSVHSLNSYLKARRGKQDDIFGRCATDCIDVINGQPFIGELIRFFRRRMRY